METEASSKCLLSSRHLIQKGNLRRATYVVLYEKLLRIGFLYDSSYVTMQVAQLDWYDPT